MKDAAGNEVKAVQEGMADQPVYASVFSSVELSEDGSTLKVTLAGSDEVLEFYVSGEQIEAVHMLPGYTHNIINLSETDNLVTVMWANEAFDPDHPDTYFEKVK